MTHRINEAEIAAALRIWSQEGAVKGRHPEHETLYRLPTERHEAYAARVARGIIDIAQRGKW